jgi:tRNA U34 5-carboxymethylaminomethyl modifying GTPase MnmE/TrmE
MDQYPEDHQAHEAHRDHNANCAHRAHCAREAILTANQQMATLLENTKSVLDGNSEAHRQWAQTNASIARYILDQVVRIAVVGAIKSGKSSMVNALLSRDYLKRGAGVATSIVTRMRQGDLLKARRNPDASGRPFKGAPFFKILE